TIARGPRAMSAAVIDASVGVKWFVPEVYSTEAREWRNASELHTLSVFFDIEIANILWKKVRRSELGQTDAEAILSQLTLLPIERHDELVRHALGLANDTQQTVYDCLYLALAVELGGQMVTADERLVNSLVSTPWAKHVRWVADSPPPPKAVSP